MDMSTIVFPASVVGRIRCSDSRENGVGILLARGEEGIVINEQEDSIHLATDLADISLGRQMAVAQLPSNCRTLCPCSRLSVTESLPTDSLDTKTKRPSRTRTDCEGHHFVPTPVLQVIELMAGLWFTMKNSYVGGSESAVLTKDSDTYNGLTCW